MRRGPTFTEAYNTATSKPLYMMNQQALMSLQHAFLPLGAIKSYTPGL